MTCTRLGRWDEKIHRLSDVVCEWMEFVYLMGPWYAVGNGESPYVASQPRGLNASIDCVASSIRNLTSERNAATLLHMEYQVVEFREVVV